jgi:37-kD nucleoid-associated bacterial protein
MLPFTDASPGRFIIHQVGNKLNEEGYTLSEKSLPPLTEELQVSLTNYFLSAFKEPEYYSFWHESDLALNACCSFAKDIFSDNNSFVEKSQSIARHLYECSTHPKIKSGDLYIALLQGNGPEGEALQALAIFKTESKDTFLQVTKEGEYFALHSSEGQNINKADKGCIIFNTNGAEGYKVCVVDNLNRGSEAQYWKDDFLKLISFVDEYHQTREFLGIAKHYVTDQYAKEFDVSKTDQIDLLNRSISYFKTHPSFEKNEFETEVLHHPEMISSFQKFDDQYRKQNHIELEDSFDISKQAVRKQARVFKSVLKLDKNFHIYIHGNREMIEKGVDEQGRKYYKIFYNEEQ